MTVNMFNYKGTCMHMFTNTQTQSCIVNSHAHIYTLHIDTHTWANTWWKWYKHSKYSAAYDMARLMASFIPPLILAFCAPGQVLWEQDRESELEVWLLSLWYIREDNGGWTLLTAVLAWWGRLYRSAFVHNSVEMSNIVIIDCHPSR